MKSFVLKALGHEWKVRIVKKHKGLLAKDDACILYPEHSIIIRSTLTDGEQRSKLLHELIHMVLDYNHIKLQGDEEDVIMPLETGLFAIIHDNELRF